MDLSDIFMAKLQERDENRIRSTSTKPHRKRDKTECSPVTTTSFSDLRQKLKFINHKKTDPMLTELHKAATESEVMNYSYYTNKQIHKGGFEGSNLRTWCSQKRLKEAPGNIPCVFSNPHHGPCGCVNLIYHSNVIFVCTLKRCWCENGGPEAHLSYTLGR